MCGLGQEVVLLHDRARGVACNCSGPTGALQRGGDVCARIGHGARVNLPCLDPCGEGVDVITRGLAHELVDNRDVKARVTAGRVEDASRARHVNAIEKPVDDRPHGVERSCRV